MRQICCVCKKLFALKDPFDDDSETHGFCPECFKMEMAKLEQYKENGVDPWKKVEPTS